MNVNDFFFKRAYLPYFKVKPRDQDTLGMQSLRRWTKGSVDRCHIYEIPVTQRGPGDHNTTDSYFYLTNTAGVIPKTRKTITYLNLDSAIGPMSHFNDVPISVAIITHLTHFFRGCRGPHQMASLTSGQEQLRPFDI